MARARIKAQVQSERLKGQTQPELKLPLPNPERALSAAACATAAKNPLAEGSSRAKICNGMLALDIAKLEALAEAANVNTRGFRG